MNGDPLAIALITLGSVFLAGLAADLLGRRTRLPRVTLLLLLGVCVGPLGLDLFPQTAIEWFPFITHLALLMVAFLLGGELTPSLLREYGRQVMIVSLVIVAATAAVVTAGLAALGWPLTIAVLLGAIATSTDPAAVSDVVRQSNARGPFTSTLLGIVAVDDAWGIVALSIAMVLVIGAGQPDAAPEVLLEGAIHLGGAILVGCAIGVPMAMLTGRIREGEPTQAEALGGVLLCGGIAISLGVSYLLASMTMGVVVANLARHHTRPFRAIEGIEWPFMVLFFVLSGASIEVAGLGSVAGLTTAYVLLRTLGRWLGGRLATHVDGGRLTTRGIGPSLLPQAGIAIGMALVASQRVPEYGAQILTATVAGTIVFELIGPILTRRSLVHAREVEAD
ncbi:MAG: cation:proton antiporter [bacterium]|nr:cation:proton antiporter [bacterium]